MYLLGLLLWIAASGGLAWLVARLLSRWSSKLWLRPLLTLILLPAVFLAPLSDEIVGKFQFDRLCEEAKEVKIYATHPVGEEFYTSEGKWREGKTPEEEKQLRETYESLVRWDLGPKFPEVVPAVITIWKYHGKIFDRAHGRLLAEWVQYGTSGGWFSRNLQGPILVRSQCIPEIGRRLDQRILPFKKNSEDRK